MKTFSKLWKRYSFLLLVVFLTLSLFHFAFALGAIICMLAPVILSFFKGRFWCGNYCPRGSFYDNVLYRFSSKRKIPKFLKSYYFRITLFTIMMIAFTIGLVNAWGDLEGMGMVFYRMILITTIMGIVLTPVFHHRVWCHICPMGTLSSLVAKARKSRLVLTVENNCVSCTKCQSKCPLEIIPSVYKGNLLNHPDCIQCQNCVSTCPKKSIHY